VINFEAAVAKGNNETLVDNFEFQIEVRGRNLTIFAGGSSVKPNARKNNITLSLCCDDGLTLRLGNNISPGLSG